MSRPVLKPALSRAWRDTETLQLGTVQRHAHRLGQTDETVRSLLGLLDGEHERCALLEAGERLGLGRDAAAGLIDALEREGLLDDAAAVDAALGRFPRPLREQLGPDLASLSLVHPGPGDAAAVLARRAGRTVEVRGAGRVGSAVAAVLAAGGIGTVTVTDGGRVSAGDCSPTGLPPSDVGRLRGTAVREVVQRATGVRRCATRSPRALPALVVLAPRDGGGAFACGSYESKQLMRAGVPHLYAGVVERIGVVGPLVVPGGSACGTCLLLAREDEDAAWPRLLTQIAGEGPGRAPTPACDTAVATAVAGLAALHVQLFLDGGEPASLGGWCELSAEDGMVRRLRLKEHPHCGCLWDPGEGVV
ncbi:ThiF family adenylyltransferase [Kitasatospora sp. NPDC004240]